MRPTAELRYAEQEVYVGQGDYELQLRLQQLWESAPDDNGDRWGEWRDVPTVRIK